MAQDEWNERTTYDVFESFVALGQRRAAESPDKIAYLFLKDGELEEARLTFAELDRRCRALAVQLTSRGLKGERVLLLYPSGLDFVIAFLGCLYAGALAVPAYMPQQRREHWQRLEAIAIDCDARLILGTVSSLGSLRESIEASPVLGVIPALASDTVTAETAQYWIDPGMGCDDLAFLQYTSGSTGSPKGVMVSHGNLLHNQMLMRDAFGHHRDSVLVSWLPLFHDMGLIGNVLHTLYLGARCILMSPVAFLQSPIRWLNAISTYRAHSSFAPNFAYELCVRRIGEEQRATLDLSSWSFALNGAEPVRADTLRRFSEYFAPCGYAAKACYPGYGLAEVTLFAAGGDRFGGWIEHAIDAEALASGLALPAAEAASALCAVSSGRAWHDQAISIVDPQTQLRCEDGEIGEIWLCGPSVARGYWQKPDATDQTFFARIRDDDRSWLRTGDLGFLRDGALFVSGRLKEVVIIRGRNYYPQDIEYTVQQSMPGLRPDGGAAFSIDDGAGERLVVVQEIERTALRGFDTATAAQAVRAAIAEVHEIPLGAVVFIKPATLPKTSSGKIQRGACRSRFQKGTLTEIGRQVWIDREERTSEHMFDRDALLRLPHEDRVDPLLGDVREWLAARLGVDADVIRPDWSLTGLGLDSMRAVEFQHLLETRLGAELSLAALLALASVRDLAVMLAQRVSAESAAACDAPLLPASALSLNQRALWLQHQLSGGAGVYSIALPVRLRQRIDIEALSQAHDALVVRHAQLRTVFVDIDGEPHAHTHDPDSVSLQRIDAETCDDTALCAQVTASAHRHFEIGRGPNFVVELYTRAADDHVLLLKAHHLVVDLWSMQVLLKEFLDSYAALCAGANVALPVAGDYRQYVAWQAQWLQTPAAEAAGHYWRERLVAPPPPLALSTARRPALQTYGGHAYDFEVPADCRAALAALAAGSGTTLHTVLLAAYQILLCRYSGEDAVCVGTPVADRPRGAFADVIGYFVNPLPLIGEVADDPCFTDYLARTREAMLGALEHRHYPFLRMIESAGLQRDSASSPLFQTMFVYQSAHILEDFSPFVLGMPGARLRRGGLEIETYPLPCAHAQMDVSLTVVDSGAGLWARLEYNTDLFGQAAIKRLTRAWLTLLRGIVADPACPVLQLDVLAPAELQQLQAFNRTERDYPEQLLLADIIARQALRTPDAVALVAEDITLSYTEFARRVDILVGRLQQCGIGVESRVVVSMERGADLVVALHAVLKAGAAYVPVDPHLPAVRIAHIFDSAQPRLTLIGEGDDIALPGGVAVLRLDAGMWQADASSRAAYVAVCGDNAAYVIYTSGSTGAPKGVINTHAGICNRLLWMQDAYPLAVGDRVVQKTPFGFDVSVWEFFWPLMYGATLVVAKPEGHKDPAYLCELFAEHGVAVAHFVPSMLGQFLECGVERALPALRRVICSGEELTLALQRAFFSRHPTVELHNLYGPTEAAIDVAYWPCESSQRIGAVPIGRPVANTRLYVLDRALQPVAIGVPGELFIAGVNLARGYSAQPDLTAERFIADPFGVPGTRMYRTGDLARLRDDGAIEYLGRTDFQIKLRGLRIELGEIESAILAHGLARETVVVAREFAVGDQRLVAYLVGGDGDRTRFSAALRAVLPEYMVPAHVVALDALPLSANGKIDRRALPAPQIDARTDAELAPEGEIECALAAIWEVLLGVRNVGRDSHFFALGGHSLIAMRMGANVRSRFNIPLTLADVYRAPRLCDQAALIARTAKDPALFAAIESIPVYVPVSDTDAEYAPLSRAQQRLWFLEQLDPHNPVYNVPMAIDWQGPVDVDALDAALRRLVTHHAILRMRFVERDGVPMQRMDAVPAALFETADLSALPASECEARITQAINAAALQGFDLTNAPPLRVELLIVGPSRAVLLLTLHHIVSDGRSVEILLDALWAEYRNAAAGRASLLPPPSLQYADYARWEQTARAPETQQHQLAFWRERLSGMEPLSTVPADVPRPPRRRFRGASLPFVLAADITARIETQSRRCGVTLGTFLFSAFLVVVARHAGRSDLTVGMPVSTRERDELQPLLGFFVNTLPIRSHIDTAGAFADVLQRVNGDIADALAHKDIFFDELVEHLQPERAADHNPLVQLLFACQEAPPADWQDDDTRWRRRAYRSEVAKFDLTAAVEYGPDGLGGYFEYDTDLYARSTIATLIAHYGRLLVSLADDAQTMLAGVPWLSDDEQQALLARYDHSDTVYPLLSAHALFARAAAHSPQSPALRHAGAQITYAQLQQRASAAAAALYAAGVRPGMRVGLCMARSTAMVVVLLAILKNGAAYVPVDPRMPPARRARLLADAEAVVLVADSSIDTAASAADARMAIFDGDRLAASPDAPDWRDHDTTPDHPAYVMYTSGSTGEPKGVMVPHRGIVRLLFGVDQIAFGPERRLLHAASIAFDASTFELWGALLHGGICVLYPDAVPTPEGLRRAIRDDGVDTMWLTSSLFNTIVEADAGCLAGLSQLLVGGDRVSARHVARAQAAAPGLQAINGYGPTESTTFASCHPIAPIDIAAMPAAALREVPIGGPVGNTALYVLDDHLQWVPPGVPGVLYIGGDGLALGYLGAATATATAFVPDPFSRRPGARMYCTGDLVRHMPEGVVEFIRRRDHQVKIRGFRVELEEIEAELQRMPQLRTAAVRVQGEGEGKRLVAYAVARAGDVYDPQALLADLRVLLPDYMVPSRLLMLDAIALTANGKLDRASLPEVEFTADNDHYEAPRDALETALADVWKRALALPRIGIHDDFFALGGHSLLAMRIAARWRECSGRELPVRYLFEYPSIAALAAALRIDGTDAPMPSVADCPAVHRPRPTVRSQYSALSFAQQRLWFLEQLEGPSPLYSMVAAVRVTGDFEPDAFETALHGLGERHESLRTRFVLVDDAPVQEVLARADLALRRIDLSALDAATAETTLQAMIARESATPFDLAQAPLLRAFAIRTAADRHVLVFNMHHIVSDGWSVDVMIRELSRAYASQQHDAPLAALPLQYVDFACWQRELLQAGHFEPALAYWRERLHGMPPLLPLPVDHQRPAVQDPRGERLPLVLPSALTHAIRKFARDEGASVFMVLLAGFSALLARHSGQNDIAVGAPIANRNDPVLEGLIGFFANTIVLRAQVEPGMSFRELLRCTRDRVLEAQTHQALPFEQLVETLNPVRSPSHSPLFQTMFAYENIVGSRWRLGGLAVEPIDVDTGFVKFDLLLSLRDDGDAIAGAFEYRSGLFERDTAQRWSGHLLALLAAAVRAPDRPLHLHPLLGDDERCAVTERLNRTATIPPPTLCLHGMFERHAALAPEAIAILHGEERWSYRMLDARADRIARAMMACGVGRGTRVAVYLERGPQLIATLLATLKAGAAYVPLDPKYPRARNADIVLDTAPMALVSQQGLADDLATECVDAGAVLLLLDAIDAADAGRDTGAEMNSAAKASVAASPTLRDPAYFIFTSGSTGRPKGIVISHRSAATMLAWARGVYDDEALAVVLASTSICFDLSIYEIFLPLSLGRSLLLVDDALALPQAPFRDQVTLINTVPSAMTALLETTGLPSGLRTVNLAGEPLTRRLADEIYRRTAASRVYNLYGPSEDTTYSTFVLVPRDEADKPTIGRPIANTHAYVLDAFGAPAPLGVAGELYLAGDGLAEGYWNRPDLTAAAFVPDPFCAAPGARMYRTGDWVRMRADGELEYIGRIDHQVKLNGFRIELGEIEHRLLRCPGIVMACAVVRQDPSGFDRLVAYFAGDGSAAPDLSAIRRRLEEALPHFMVPGVLVALDALPLLPNGKIDRRALPEPQGWGDAGAEHVPPRTQTEVQLAAIWSELLHRPQVGVHDNFFEIGGHSLLAAQISLRVKQLFEVELPIRAVFQSATIEAMAEEIENRRWIRQSMSAPADALPADALEEGTL